MYRRKGGSVIEVDTSASVIYYDGKLALCAVSRDLTERKRAEEALRHSEERFRSLVQNVSDLITILDADGTIRYDSPAVERMLGYGLEERLEASAFDYVHPEDVGRMRRSFAEALDSPGIQTPLEFRVQHKDGSWRHLEVTRSNLLSDPAVRGVVANSRDVTERKLGEQALAEERNLLRTLIDNMPDFIFVKDAESRFVLNNAEHARALAATEEELVGKTDFDVFSQELAQRYYSDEREVIRTGLPLVDKEEPITDSEGVQRWLSTTKVPLRNSEGEVTGLVGISRDMTDRKHLEEQLRHRAFHDPLTDLPNRALFLDRLEHGMARAQRMGKSVAVLFVDLDDFKVVNDSLGHEMGDHLLVAVADRLSSCVRPGDTVARIFGDEFAVLLEAPSGIEDAQRIARRMEQRLREPFVIGGQEIFVMFCAGIALGESTAGLLPKDVLWRADLAMYEAKNRGKNACQVYHPSTNTHATERLNQETALRRAVEREELTIHYQPIIDLRTGKAGGVEALVRWRHPQHGLLDASEFIVLAEETGLISSIDRWVMEEACKQATRWAAQHPDGTLLLSVNLSAAQFSHHPDLISEVLSSTGLEPSSLQIEITERAMMNNAEFAIGKLQSLKNLGVQFAIDDYGTGYSCLSYLKRMPVDSLKIDQSFVSDLGNSPNDAAIVAATIDLAHALGLNVVAEGVENANQLVRLRQLGCDLAQGFHLCRPLGAEAVSKLLFEGCGW
jgi:diguanylate cyclase (GGDEF)-like protein/PAS domain S-box-containing protein